MLSFNEMSYATRELHTKPPFSVFSFFKISISKPWMLFAALK